MARYLLGRSRQVLLTLVIIAVAVFFMVRLAPGDPAELLLPEGATPNQVAAVRAEWGLDRPLYFQLATYLGRLVRGDLGESFAYHQPAVQVVLERMPYTLALTGTALLLALVVAMPLGVLSAARHGGFLDAVTGSIALAAQSVPSFWLGLQLILIFSLHLKLLPSSGADGWRYMILPAVTLAADVTALMIRIVRVEMIAALHQDFIRTARAKGAEYRSVLFRHAFKNAAIPVVTVIGLRFGVLLGGAVVTETIFGWPGLGRLTIQSVQARDYPLLQAIVLVVASLFLFLHLAVDLLYAYLDPRIRYETNG